MPLFPGGETEAQKNEKGLEQILRNSWSILGEGRRLVWADFWLV